MNLSGRTLFPLFFLTVVSYFLYRVREILLPFILAAVLAYLFSPLVRFFEVHGFRRRPVVLVLFISLVSILALTSYKLAWVAASEADQAAQNMPVYVHKGGETLARLRQSLQSEELHDDGRPFQMLAHRLFAHTMILDYVAEHGKIWPREILTRMPSFAMGILPILEIAFLVPFIGFFLIQEGPHLRDHLLGWVPSRYVEMTLGLMVEIDNSLGKYVRGLLLECLCVGCIALAGFWIIGLDYALQVAIVVGFANIVPYIGPIMGVVLGSGIALFQWGSAFGIVKVFTVCASVRFIEDWFIQPNVMRSTVHLHPAIVVFALMSGAKLFGFWGLLFGVPVACMVKVLLEVLWPWYRSQYGFASPLPLPEVNRIPLI
jgi:predicted PurR-regulated permease PerM